MGADTLRPVACFFKAGRRDNVWFSSSLTPHQHVVSSQDSLDIPWTLGPPQAKTLSHFLTSSSSPCPAVVSSLTSAHTHFQLRGLLLPAHPAQHISAGSPDRAPQLPLLRGGPAPLKLRPFLDTPTPAAAPALPRPPPPALCLHPPQPV